MIPWERRIGGAARKKAGAGPSAARDGRLSVPSPGPRGGAGPARHSRRRPYGAGRGPLPRRPTRAARRPPCRDRRAALLPRGRRAFCRGRGREPRDFPAARARWLRSLGGEAPYSTNAEWRTCVHCRADGGPRTIAGLDGRSPIFGAAAGRGASQVTRDKRGFFKSLMTFVGSWPSDMTIVSPIQPRSGKSYLKLAHVSLAKKLQEVFQNEPSFERSSRGYT
jgi:hypothetical protein